MSNHEAFTLALLGFPFLLLWLAMAAIMWSDSRREKREAAEIREDISFGAKLARKEN